MVNSLVGHLCAHPGYSLVGHLCAHPGYKVSYTPIVFAAHIHYSLHYSVGFVVLGWILYKKLYVATNHRLLGLSHHL